MAFFDFTGANGSPIPDFFTEENGSVEIHNNQLTLSEVSASDRWAASYPANMNDTQSVDVMSTSSESAGLWYLRHVDVDNNLALLFVYNKDEIRLITFTNGSYYALETVDFNLPTGRVFSCEAETTDDRVIIRVDGTEIINHGTTKFNTATRSALGGNGETVDVYFDNLLTTPAIGTKPTITDSGEQNLTVFKDGAIPSFTITATDAEDGDITDRIVGSADSLDLSETGTQVIAYSVTDTDGNRATYDKTFTIITKPTLKLPIEVRNPLELKVGQTFTLPRARYHNPDRFDYGNVVGTGWNGTDTAGSQVITYEYDGGNGYVADPIELVVNVVPVPDVADPYPFSMLQEYVGDKVTVDGYELTYFENAFGTAFGYGFDGGQTVNSTGIKNATNNSTEPKEVALITLPFDTAALAKRITVFVRIDLSEPVPNSEIQLGFSKIRNAEKFRLKASYGSGRSRTLEFNMLPTDAEHFRIGLIGNGNDPEGFINSHNDYFNVSLTNEVHIPVYIKFGNDNGGVTLSNVTVYAVVGPSAFNRDNGFLDSRERVDLLPFSTKDPLNTPLPSNVVVRPPVMTYNRNVQNFDHFSITAGSDIATVGQTDGVRVGDMVMIFRQTHSVISGTPSFESEGGRLGAVQTVRTQEQLGIDVRVAEVIDGTTLRLSKPAKVTYKSSDDPVDYLKRFYGLVALTAENASILIGDENDSWSVSQITGKEYSGSRAVAYAGQKQVYYVKSTDPIERFNYSRLVEPNTWLFPIPSDADTTSTFGEAIDDGWFEMPTPVEFDGTFNNANNADRNTIFIMPNKRYAVSVYLANPKDENGHYSCGRVTAFDLSKYSIPDILFKENLKDGGESTSTRASSISMAAGYIRNEEADAIRYSGYDTDAKIDADMERARNAIPHAITYVPASPVLQSQNYIDDNGNTVAYFSHESYVIQPIVVNGGTGYQVGDVLYLGCANVLDTVEFTRFAVQAVDSSGAIIKVFTTHTGQHKLNCASANHAPYKTSGSGTGAVFDTSTYITQNTARLKSAAYPATIIDGDAHISLYAGSNPMGGVCTINPDIDLHNDFKTKIKARIAVSGQPELSDSYEFYAILCAIEKYGLIPCDTSTGTSVMFALDENMSDEQRSAFMNNAGSVYRNPAALRRYLVPVENYTPTHGLTNQDLIPELSIEGDNGLLVSNDWTDIGAHAYSRLYGDLRVTADPAVDRSDTRLQLLNYQLTDPSGNQSNVATRSVQLRAVSSNPPIASGGQDLNVEAGETVILDGSTSLPGDNPIAGYLWEQIGGDSVAITGATTATAEFVSPTTPNDQTLIFKLTVTDSAGVIDTDNVNVRVAGRDIESTLNVMLSNIPDGTYDTRVIDAVNGTLPFFGPKIWVGGTATFTLTGVEVGTNCEVFALKPNDLPAGGVRGVTE